MTNEGFLSLVQWLSRTVFSMECYKLFRRWILWRGCLFVTKILVLPCPPDGKLKFTLLIALSFGFDIDVIIYITESHTPGWLMEKLRRSQLQSWSIVFKSGLSARFMTQSCFPLDQHPPRQSRAQRTTQMLLLIPPEMLAQIILHLRNGSESLVDSRRHFTRIARVLWSKCSVVMHICIMLIGWIPSTISISMKCWTCASFTSSQLQSTTNLYRTKRWSQCSRWSISSSNRRRYPQKLSLATGLSNRHLLNEQRYESIHLRFPNGRYMCDFFLDSGHKFVTACPVFRVTGSHPCNLFFFFQVSLKRKS